MRINTHILSLMGQRTLSQTTRALARAMQRLASGQRINSARDDAAGMAIATGLESQRRGMMQAVRNMNDARGFLETADGAVAEQTNILQRMRELAIQAANGTLSDTERTYLNTEVQQFVDELNRIAKQTEFNGVKLLDGSFTTSTLQVGTQKDQTISFNISNMQASRIFTQQLTLATGTYAARKTIAVDTLPQWVEAIDVNADGKLDLLSTSANQDTLSIALGNGDGTFRTRTTIQTAVPGSSTTRGFSTADVNSDGKTDVIVADYSGLVSVLMSNGNGTFQTRTTLAAGTNLYKAIAADVDGDSKLDIVTADFTDGTLSIMLGNGNGTFNARTTLAAGGGPSYSLLAKDLNGDNKLDLLTTNQTGNFTTYMLGNGNGTFQNRVTINANANPYGVISEDLNGDGKLDIIATAQGDSLLSISIGNGDGTFAARTTIASGGSPFLLASADLNADGRLDLIVPDYGDNTLSVFIGNGNGTFQNRKTVASGVQPQSVTVADLNGDGFNDLISGDRLDGTLSIFVGNSALRSVEQTVSLLTQEDAQDALSYIDTALAYVSSARVNLGSTQSRLDFAINSTQIGIENISSARSEIMDTDMAQETAEFTRLQVLQKAGIAVLGQANMNLKLVLELLR